MGRSGAGEQVGGDEPCYVISVASRMVGVHAQTLRSYERQGLLDPARTGGNIRLYSRRDVEQARWIRALMEDLGINLAGVEVIIRLNARIEALERRIAAFEEGA
ncbi:MAG: MerR family transcriptional regulator [Chloroflexota bacterium]